MNEPLEEPKLRLPPEQPLGELVLVAGNEEVDECSVSLRFWGDDLMPDEITQLLGINPTQAYKKGDISRGKVYDLVRKTGFWRYSLTKDEGRSLELQLCSIFERSTSSPEVWQELTTRFGAELFCGLWLKQSNRIMELSPQILQKISERGLRICFDIYCET
jgi:Domain of unknown function (DUF4279)